MSLITKREAVRAVGELAVIVVGVLVALAADRWLVGLDQRELEVTYLAQLTDNLRADSLALEAQIENHQRRRGWIEELQAGLTGSLPHEEDATEFLRRFDRFASWTPFESRRETWDDIISTGNMVVIRDDSLRQGLSAYYNSIEAAVRRDVDMDQQLTTIEMRYWELLEPDRRLAIISPDSRSRPATMDEVRAALDLVRRERPLYSGLVQAWYMHRNLARAYSRTLRTVSELLGVVQA